MTSRIEEYLEAILEEMDIEDYPEESKSRIELYLMAIAAKLDCDVPAFDNYPSRTEAWLDVIKDKAGGGVTPTGNINITDTQVTDVTNYATAQVVDDNLVPENIKLNTSILGVPGIYEGQGGSMTFAMMTLFADEDTEELAITTGEEPKFVCLSADTQVKAYSVVSVFYCPESYDGPYMIKSGRSASAFTQSEPAVIFDGGSIIVNTDDGGTTKFKQGSYKVLYGY